MRLSTAADRDEARAIRVLHAALDAGVTFLDTAGVYCLGEGDEGHNERLVALALRTWAGDRSRIEVGTKGGLRRVGRAWETDGRAAHLRSACEASRRALGVDAIDLYQLHAPDPVTPIETSVRALAALQRVGAIRAIGLCNVTVGQIEAAQRIAEIASVQVSLSPLDDEYLRNGVAEYCRDHGIRLLAYRPLGGERRGRLARDPVLSRIAASHDASPEQVALAWLMDLGVVPLPGATREETARSLAGARTLRLDSRERDELDARFNGRLLRTRRDERRPPDDAPGDVVLVMGMPGAGKTRVAGSFVARGYSRLNRDDRGGSLSALVAQLDAGLTVGSREWVLDNTYPSRASRNEVIETAWRHGVKARCVWVATTIADAQVNAISRMIEIHGRLPGPAEIRGSRRRDPRFFGPDAQFRYERSVEPPDAAEGFASVERVEFHRTPRPNAARTALVIELDGVLAAGTGGAASLLDPEQVRLTPGVREAMERYRAAGWLVFVHAWRPQVGRGEATEALVEESFARARGLAGFDFPVRYCPHVAGPPVCWCRKPLPGLVLEFALANDVALERSLSVGRGPADRTLAERLGVRYVELAEFLASRP